MNNPWNMIRAGNGFSPENYQALKIMFWEGMICRNLNLPGQNFVQ